MRLLGYPSCRAQVCLAAWLWLHATEDCPRATGPGCSGWSCQMPGLCLSDSERLFTRATKGTQDVVFCAFSAAASLKKCSVAFAKLPANGKEEPFLPLSFLRTASGCCPHLLLVPRVPWGIVMKQLWEPGPCACQETLCTGHRIVHLKSLI